jgi:hypothetical protein
MRIQTTIVMSAAFVAALALTASSAIAASSRPLNPPKVSKLTLQSKNPNTLSPREAARRGNIVRSAPVNPK